jgi:uncharacterized protein YegP (UPF0339 family)
MRTFLACIVMTCFLAGFTGISSPTTQAQDKVKTKVKDSKKGGTIEIAAGKDDKFRFFVRDADGKLLAMSGPGGFATEKDAEKAVDVLREVVETAKVHIRKSAKEKDTDK